VLSQRVEAFADRWSGVNDSNGIEHLRPFRAPLGGGKYLYRVDAFERDLVKTDAGLRRASTGHRCTRPIVRRPRSLHFIWCNSAAHWQVALVERIIEVRP
jgi:hypothetical protein